MGLLFSCLIKRNFIFVGPGCSSLAYGAFQELGPFRVNSDGKTLHKNKFAWNHGKFQNYFPFHPTELIKDYCYLSNL